ncbi:MAG: aminotransferase class V-fold PLP-dependent enzyme [Chitinophagaceae bacterium]
MQLLNLLNPGDEVIAANDMYGGTYRLFTKIFEKYGLKFHFVDMQDANNINQYINANTKLIWTETPTNPMMNITDIKAVAEIAKQHNIMVCVDNTFASPYLQTPLDLGADIVLHSATKYLGGHSDVVHGCLIMNDAALEEKLTFYSKQLWCCTGPARLLFSFAWIKNITHPHAKAL